MSKQRIVKDEIWDDEWFYDLDPIEKLVWLFLLTNNRCNIAGVYKLNLKWAARTTGLDADMFPKVLARFVADDKVAVYEDWLILKNFHKHQSINPKVELGVIRILKDLPEKVRELLPMDSLSIAYPTLLNSTLLNSTLPNGENPPETPDEKSKKFDEEDMRLTDLLITRITANNPDWKMRGSKETWATHIEKLRRIDGMNVKQIEFMINWTQSDSFWQQNILSTAKLREKFYDLIPKLKAALAKGHQDLSKSRKRKMV